MYCLISFVNIYFASLLVLFRMASLQAKSFLETPQYKSSEYNSSLEYPNTPPFSTKMVAASFLPTNLPLLVRNPFTYSPQSERLLLCSTAIWLTICTCLYPQSTNPLVMFTGLCNPLGKSLYQIAAVRIVSFCIIILKVD